MFFPSSLGSKLARLGTLAHEDGEITVLLVEDSRTVRIRLRDTLQTLPGVRVLEAGTLAEARVLLDQDAAGLFCAVLDLTLPDASGSEIVDLVSGYEVPIIVLTGTLNPEVRRARCWKSGPSITSSSPTPARSRMSPTWSPGCARTCAPRCWWSTIRRLSAPT